MIPSNEQSFESVSLLSFENLPPTGRQFPFFSQSRRLLALSITQRLILGFLIPALIAAVATGVIGVQSSQMLTKETNFYQNLFNSYSSLTTGSNYLQLMSAKVYTTLTDASTPDVTHETLVSDRAAIQKLETRYSELLSTYMHNDLLDLNAEQLSLVIGAGHTNVGVQQRSLANSVVRTWRVYLDAQERVVQLVLDGNLAAAQNLQHVHGEPTHTDALSALRTLIQFDGDLVNFVRDATSAELWTFMLTTVISTLLVVIVIGLTGWLIAGTLLPRLRHLRDVFRTVESGRMHARVSIDGRDEITEVSVSVNRMLDTVVGLLEETRRQHDALVSASERLFADMRVANKEELRIAAHENPIGMLSNAFNFTIGRFRRFVLRTQGSLEQLELLVRRQNEHAEAFARSTRQLLQQSRSGLSNTLATQFPALPNTDEKIAESVTSLEMVQRVGEHLLPLKQQPIHKQLQTLLNLATQGSQFARQARNELRTIEHSSTLIEHFSTLEMLLSRLQKEVQLVVDHTTNDQRRIEMALSLLMKMAHMGDVNRSAHTTVSSSQMDELLSLADNFARSSLTFTQQLRSIIQEMRASLIPFQLEATAATSGDVVFQSE